MGTLSFKIPTKDVVVFKGAAKQLSMDLIVEQFIAGEEWVEVHALTNDITSIVSLAYIAGADAIYVGIVNPLNQLIDSFERKIQKFDNNSKEQTHDNS